MKKAILKKLSSTENNFRKTNQGAHLFLDRRTAENLFKKENKEFTKTQFHDRVMRTVRALKEEGYLRRVYRGTYMLTDYGKRMATNN